MPHPSSSPRPRPAASITRGLAQRGASVAQWLRLPGTAGAPECASIRYWNEPAAGNQGGDRDPVIFVHGYAGTEHIWGPLRSAFSDAGFGHLIALRYNAFRADIHRIADWLVDQAHRSMAVAGAGGVHLIGHSMGGLVVRDAVQNRGLADRASTAVTIATPHAGTALARYVPGPCARQMRPGSDFLTDLNRGPTTSRTRWVAVRGGADRVVRQASVGFDFSSPAVLTVHQSSAGHGSVARHPDVVRSIVREIIRSEELVTDGFSLAA
jgi:triacylglycerol esterase/lipase EstA (alpha/beta hydrolase family)